MIWDDNGYTQKRMNNTQLFILNMYGLISVFVLPETSRVTNMGVCCYMGYVFHMKDFLKIASVQHWIFADFIKEFN